VLREAIVLVRPEARRAGEGEVRLRTELRGAPPVKANAGELREILVSLMLYAREQLSQGGELSIESELLPEGGACCQLLYRTVGRAPLSAQAWFEPFLGTEAPASIALVASSARESLSRWGGALDAHSTADGAEFLLTFAPAKPKEAKPQPMPEIAQPKVSRVLVIDDDLDNASMLAEVLTSEGHQADTATTGAEALAKWRAGRYDVALVDFLMPDTSGIELSKQLRALQPQARLALVTGWELDAEQRKAAPVHAVFRKPVDLEQLLSFLNPAPPAEEHPAPEP
jgi:CheY-like chemotaxis protein